VGHDAEPVLLRVADLGLAVLRVGVAAEAVLRVMDAVPGHLREVVLRQARLEDDRAGVDLHAVRMEVREALRRGDRERLRGDGIVRPARRMHAFTRGDDRRDATVHIRVEEVDGLLPGCVVAEHDVAVGVDEPGDDGRAPAVHHDVGARRACLRRGAQGGDPPVLNQDRLGLEPGRREDAGREGADVDEAEGRHQYSPRQRSTVAFAACQSYERNMRRFTTGCAAE